MPVRMSQFSNPHDSRLRFQWNWPMQRQLKTLELSSDEKSQMVSRALEQPLAPSAAFDTMGGKLSFAANANLIGARFDCGRSAGGATCRPRCDASVRFEPRLAGHSHFNIRLLCRLSGHLTDSVRLPRTARRPCSTNGRYRYLRRIKRAKICVDFARRSATLNPLVSREHAVPLEKRPFLTAITEYSRTDYLTPGRRHAITFFCCTSAPVPRRTWCSLHLAKKVNLCYSLCTRKMIGMAEVSMEKSLVVQLQEIDSPLAPC